MDVLDQLQRDGWELHSDEGFVGLVGPFVKRTDDQGLIFGFPTLDKHRNHGGVVQGGALITFADRALGFAARAATKATRTATVQMNVQFVDAVKIGEFVQARPVVTRATKQIVFMDTTLTVGLRIVAKAQGVWKILTAR